MKRLSYIFLFFSLSGCAHPDLVTVSGADWPLSAIRYSIRQALPIGSLPIQKGGREISSKPFLQKYRGVFVPASNSRIRYRAVTYISGPVRPHTVEVRVYVEKKFKNRTEYVRTGTNKAIARILAVVIQRQLEKRKKERSFVDDFRIF